MISINKPYDNPPETLAGNTCEENLQKFLNEECSVNKHFFSAKDVVSRLVELYNNKCAICETYTGNEPVILHYRPYEKITGKKHNGYRCLIYEWSNLLPVCHSCKESKGNHFPISDEESRVTEHCEPAKRIPTLPPLKDENPLLLNPEIDDPKDYFYCKPNGVICPVDNNPRAIKSREIYDLNSPRLEYERKRICDTLLENIQTFTLAYKDCTLNCKSFVKFISCEIKKMQEAQEPDNPFSLFSYSLSRNFEKFIIERLPDNNSKEIIRFVFEKFNEGKSENELIQCFESEFTQIHSSTKTEYHKNGKENAMDPLTALTLISNGLNLIDKFRKITLQFMGKKDREPSTKADKVGNTLEIKKHGIKTEEVVSDNLTLSEIDNERYKALEKRVNSQWKIYNGYFAELPLLAVDEKIRIKAKMDELKTELCKDFHEILSIYEKVLGIPLANHYTLYEVCSE